MPGTGPPLPARGSVCLQMLIPAGGQVSTVPRGDVFWERIKQEGDGEGVGEWVDRRGLSPQQEPEEV